MNSHKIYFYFLMPNKTFYLEISNERKFLLKLQQSIKKHPNKFPISSLPLSCTDQIPLHFFANNFPYIYLLYSTVNKRKIIYHRMMQLENA
jgi:hypothetical protein